MPAKSKKSKKRDTSMNDVYREDYENRDSRGRGGKRIFDLSNFKDVEWYNIKKGRNEIDIILYEITTNNHPQRRQKGKFDYKLDIWVHKFINDTDHYLCKKKTFDKPCFICEEIKRMLDSGEYTRDDKIIKQLVAKRRVIYNVVDLTSDDDYLKIKLFETSHFEFQEELLEEAESGDYEYEGEYMAFADLEDGRSIKFRGIERTGEFKTGSPKPKGFKFVERDEPYDESILDEVYPLDAILHIPEYDEVKKGFMEMENGEENDITETEDDDEEKYEPKTRKRGKKETTTKNKKKCPAGGSFGTDCEELEECEECDLWDACSKEFDKKDE